MALFILISFYFFVIRASRVWELFYIYSYRNFMRVQHAQLLLFLFLFSVAAGTILGARLVIDSDANT